MKGCEKVVAVLVMMVMLFVMVTMAKSNNKGVITKPQYVEIFGPGPACKMGKYPGLIKFKLEELSRFNQKTVTFRTTQYSPRITFYGPDDEPLETISILMEDTAENIIEALIERGFKPK